MKATNKQSDQEYDLICKAENISREELDGFFENLMQRTEAHILSEAKVPNHLTVLNRQLRAAAAVFILIAAGALFTFFIGEMNLVSGEGTYYGPYELAAGNKLVP